jgi:glyoxylase-like metal-dependent hydrolase (beta-lactamase superfamily II)
MRNIAGIVCAVAFGSVLLFAQAVRPPTLAAVATAMGADALRTIDYSGSGYTFGYQQAPGPGEPWPLFIADTYKVSVDYQAVAMRLESTRAQGEVPPRGGLGQPIKGTTRSIQFVSGSLAWSQGSGGAAQPNPAAVPDRRRQLWMTPHGLLKAAQAAKANMTGRTFALTLEGQPMTVSIGTADLIDKVDYLIDSPVLGDVPVQLVYSEYRDFGGVKFPTRIIEKTDGFLTLDIAVADVKPNAPVSIVVPQNVSAAVVRPPPDGAPRVDAKQIAPGVWHLIASGYGSMLVEFKDFLLMFEGPVDDARSIAANEWVRQNVPGKPIKYLVNTHAHFDHAGGVREYVAEGVTIVTHEMNRSYYENVWQRPRTLNPDRLAQHPRAPIWETMTVKKVLTDGVRSLELYKLDGNGHNPYILIGYLPAERILLYGDMYNPPSGADPRDSGRTNEYAENLYDNIANRLRLEPRIIVPVHGAAVPFDNLKKAIGLIPVN